jgi:NAD-dependent deacetylase
MKHEETQKKGVEELSNLMSSANYIVVLTGAGMDTESNIPDFRGKSGWWKNIDPRTVANIEAFNENYALFHEFYTMRLNLLQDVQPHRGHYILADLEERGIIKSIATQNISGLHHLAGSKNVFELHGNIKAIRCNNCDRISSLEQFLKNKRCEYCNTTALRPNVVLFGETLPPDVWNNALSEIRKADLLIVIGTSLEVYPVNQLPLVAKGKKVFINIEDRGADYSFDVTIIGKAKDILIKLCDHLSINCP